MKMNNARKFISALLTVVLLLSASPLLGSADSYFNTTASAATNGIYTYIITDGNAVITKCMKTAKGEITVPSSIGGYPVARIDNYAFQNCKELTSITIPESTTSIGRSAFENCIGLVNVIIPNSVSSIAESAFFNCKKLKNIIIPTGVIEIANYMFDLCESLETVMIPNNVTSIGDTAFYGCKSLESINIPDSVSSIGSAAFQECLALKSIIIPNGVTKIYSNTFDGCTMLSSVSIPNSVTALGFHSFNDCSSLTSVTIPDSVREIDEWAFNGCTSMKTVTIPKSVETINVGAFGYLSFSYVDSECIKDYDYKIMCYRNSAGLKYAIDNNLSYEIIDTPFQHTHSLASSEAVSSCAIEGHKTTFCTNCGETVSKTVLPLSDSHEDLNNDGKCDLCSKVTCTCRCHQSGFQGFIYKLVRIFWKLFKIKQKCECGTVHY